MRLHGINPIWVINVLVVGAAAFLFFGPLDDFSPIADPHIPWWALVVAFVVAERCVVHLQFRRSAHSFTLADLPFVFGLLFASAHDLLLASLLGSGVVLAIDRQFPPIKLVFNLGLTALSTCMAILAVHELAPNPSGVDAEVWVAVFIATEASAIIAVLLIGLAISLSERSIQGPTLLQMVTMDMVVTITNTSLALAGAVILWQEPSAIPLLLIPVATVFFAYRAYLIERQRHEKLEFLYETTRTLARSPEIVHALEGLLSRSLDAFRAEVAEIVLLSSDKGPALRTSLGPGDHKEIMQPVDESIAQELLRLVDTERPAVRLNRQSASETLGAYLDGRRITHAMVAVLPGEKRVIGTIMLANRFGVARSFNEEDLKLFETLANNASVALQYDRLEQAVVQLRELQNQLEHQAFHDPLTDLANRSLFHDSVREALRDESLEIAVLFIDVDDFKTVNDSLGHEAGDKLLQAVASRLRECVRPSDLVARLGGDEFAVLVSGVDDAEASAIMVTERIMEAFKRPVESGDVTVTVHASIGISTSAVSGRRADELVRDADVAMYQAKASGKQRFEVFQQPMRSAVLKRHGLKEELRTAVERGQLVVEYQPIFTLATGVLVGAEALVRWKHPERGQLPPAEFVPLAEETGLIKAVGEFVLRESCMKAHEWERVYPEDAWPSVHVNLSAVELGDPNLIDRVRSTVADSRIRPEQLVLEITESMLIHDTARSTTVLDGLHEVGVRLALDDFGTGYSSLSYLRCLPVDMLKIARPFVEGLTRDKRDASFVQMIVELARTLELHVVAEGIESAAELEALQELDCELGQGFYLGMPVDVRNAHFPPIVARRPETELPV